MFLASEQLEIETDAAENDSAFGDDAGKDTDSLTSSTLEGCIANGRKYATLRDDVWTPSDEQPFEAMDAGHLIYLLLESDKENPFFRCPIANPQHILDISSGSGSWAINTADKFPGALINGVDLFHRQRYGCRLTASSKLKTSMEIGHGK